MTPRAPWSCVRVKACYRCGSEVQAEAAHCPRCGRSLEGVSSACVPHVPGNRARRRAVAIAFAALTVLAVALALARA